MTFNRKPDRRPSGPRSGGFRSDRRDFDRPSGPPSGDRPFRGDRPPFREDRGDRPDRGYPPRGDRPDRGYPPRGDRPDRGFTPRNDRPPFRDEGGMSITLDPRHLGQLKRLAADAGVRPGELALQWMIERLDAESGRASQTPTPRAPGQAASPDLLARLDALSARISALEGRGTAAPKRETPAPKPEARPAAVEAAPAEAAPAAPPTEAAPVTAAAPAVEPEVEPTTATDAAPEPREPRRRSTPAPRTPSPRATAATQGERVGLHDEIAAVIGERGPMTAADLAVAIVERGRYQAPRSTKPLDAATVNSRVSNPAYRGRFTRSDGRIGLTDAG